MKAKVIVPTKYGKYKNYEKATILIMNGTACPGMSSTEDYIVREFSDPDKLDTYMSIRDSDHVFTEKIFMKLAVYPEIGDICPNFKKNICELLWFNLINNNTIVHELLDVIAHGIDIKGLPDHKENNPWAIMDKLLMRAQEYSGKLVRITCDENYVYGIMMAVKRSNISDHYLGFYNNSLYLLDPIASVRRAINAARIEDIEIVDPINDTIIYAMMYDITDLSLSDSEVVHKQQDLHMTTMKRIENFDCISINKQVVLPCPNGDDVAIEYTEYHYHVGGPIFPDIILKPRL